MKRKLFVVALAICLVAVMACGSLAYFTASHSVTNTFKVAKSDDPTPPEDPDDIFSVQVTENGNPTGQTFDGIKPGDVKDKKPVITNTGKFDQWVRVIVKFDCADKWLAIKDSKGQARYTAAGLFDALIGKVAGSGFVASKWDAVNPSAADGNNKLVYTFYLKDKLPAGDSGKVTIFEKVAIPTELSVEDMATLKEFHIEVSAEAIQADNTGNSCKGAFDNYWGK